MWVRLLLAEVVRALEKPKAYSTFLAQGFTWHERSGSLPKRKESHQIKITLRKGEWGLSSLSHIFNPLWYWMWEFKCPSFISVFKDVKLHLRSLNKYDRNSPVHRKETRALQSGWGFEDTKGFFEAWRTAWEWGGTFFSNQTANTLL